MKKIFIAVCALAAMASCVKNEPDLQRLQSDSRITFSPLVSTVTKANTTEITGTTFPTTDGFSVFAWYSEDPSFNANTATSYMSDVAVSYVTGNIDNGQGEGTWQPKDAYFWPKNGKLTFDAYYPTSVNANSTAANGLVVESFTAETDNAKQVDFLYATRVYDKSSSTETDANTTYDGVDIQFNHALSVVRVFINAKDQTAAENVKIKSVALKNIANVGKFEQKVDNSSKKDSPIWTVTQPQTSVVYNAVTEASSWTDAHAITYTAQPTTSVKQFGSSMIVLPQTFSASQPATADSPTAALVIDYYIQNGGASGSKILQTAVFELSDSSIHVDGNKTAINAWERGKRYNYHITIGVDKIYFAPSVNDWTDVNVNLPEIK